MGMKKSLIVNISIAIVLVALSIVVFSADFGRIYTTVAAPVTIGNKQHKNASLMICVEKDTDGKIIDEMMGILSENKTTATFFVAGGWVMRNSHRIQNMHSQGYEIANYGFSGKSFKTLNTEQQKKEILDTHTLVKGLTGLDMKLFSPPMGEYSKNTLKTATALGVTVVLHCCENAENLKNGDLIMICPAKVGVPALQNAITTITQQGFDLVKVSDNIGV